MKIGLSALKVAAIAVLVAVGIGSAVELATRPKVSEVTLPVFEAKSIAEVQSKSDAYLLTTKEEFKKTSLNVKSINAENVVLFNTQVTDQSVEYAINALQSFGDEKVYLVIDSPGGAVFAGAKLVNHIRYSGQNIVTVCDSVCASMGFHIFEAGKRRIMQDKALLMGHPASGGARGTIDEMLTMLNAIKLYTERMDRYIADRAKIPYEQFQLMNLRNMWIESVDAVRLGLADEVAYVNYKRGVNNDTISISAILKAKGVQENTKVTDKKFNFNWE